MKNIKKLLLAIVVIATIYSVLSMATFSKFGDTETMTTTFVVDSWNDNEYGNNSQGDSMVVDGGPTVTLTITPTIGPTAKVHITETPRKGYEGK